MKARVVFIFDILFAIFVIFVHVWGLLKLPKPERFEGWSQTLVSISEIQLLSLFIVAVSTIGLVVICRKEFHEPYSKWFSGILLGLGLGVLSHPASTVGQTVMVIALSGIFKTLDDKKI